jgi:hypothetical protein
MKFAIKRPDVNGADNFCWLTGRSFFYGFMEVFQQSFNVSLTSREMSGKSSFPYRKFDRKPHPHIVKQILDDRELIEMMKEVLIQGGKPCPFCHRKLSGDKKEMEIW